MRTHFDALWCFALAFATAHCSADTDSEAGESGLTAKIDGVAWEATPISIVAQANMGVPGSVQILGTQPIENRSLSVTITLFNVGGVGEYSLGTGSEVIGGTGQTSESKGDGTGDANSWITDSTGVAGLVAITSIADGRIKGTFEYTASPGRNNETGINRVVTEGRFDLPLNGTIAPLPENAGSKVTALMDGVPYNASSIEGGLTDFTGGAGVRFSSTSALHGVSINLVGVTAPGTFSLNDMSPQRLISAGRNTGTDGNCCWDTMGRDDAGEIVVTSLTSKRVKGTFRATLKPRADKPATENLVITEGTFDVGIR